MDVEKLKNFEDDVLEGSRQEPGVDIEIEEPVDE